MVALAGVGFVVAAFTRLECPNGAAGCGLGGRFEVSGSTEIGHWTATTVSSVLLIAGIATDGRRADPPGATACRRRVGGRSSSHGGRVPGDGRRQPGRHATDRHRGSHRLARRVRTQSDSQIWPDGNPDRADVGTTDCVLDLRERGFGFVSSRRGRTHQQSSSSFRDSGPLAHPEVERSAVASPAI